MDQGNAIEGVFLLGVDLGHIQGGKVEVANSMQSLCRAGSGRAV